MVPLQIPSRCVNPPIRIVPTTFASSMRFSGSMNTNTSQSAAQVNLALSTWELANLHLPPVTTITLYSGMAPVQFLRHRIALILEKNPWLTSRIVKKSTTDGVVAMTYDGASEAGPQVDEHFKAYEPGEVGLSLDMQYAALVECLLPLQCARSKLATDANEPLFKVAVVPVEESTDSAGPAPMQRKVALPGFALIVSMNHTMGDGHTYYRLYGMLDADQEVEALDPVRISGFEEAKTAIIGENESAMFSSAGFGLGIMGTYLFGKLTGREPQNVCVHTIDPAWVTQEKAKAAEEAQVAFVSTNDVLTSWFFREMKCDINIMVANFRSRKPAILDLADHHAGNYEANVPYFPGDFEKPALIRQSILGPASQFRARRAGSPATEVPGFSTLLRNKTAIVTNWASFYRDVALRTDPMRENSETCKPSLHLPIMEAGGLITSVWHTGIVFCPRAGELGMLMITRSFDSEALTEDKREEGSRAPMGARLI